MIDVRKANSLNAEIFIRDVVGAFIEEMWGGGITNAG